ncbi:uncharacterized protein LOC113374087 isoform X5 [Ctenocephalides felis]|uniref:uncharacterized protein LOC113374087 isoform X5 n=2 Tax=Ctenocephalides felis TaxID=7515 RepID=UPI000E6E4DAD|nr:uncharacterized protein LOC113374087 isoform X5 [Ctenocephalides felis]
MKIHLFFAALGIFCNQASSQRFGYPVSMNGPMIPPRLNGIKKRSSFRFRSGFRHPSNGPLFQTPAYRYKSHPFQTLAPPMTNPYVLPHQASASTKPYGPLMKGFPQKRSRQLNKIGTEESSGQMYYLIPPSDIKYDPEKSALKLVPQP